MPIAEARTLVRYLGQVAERLSRARYGGKVVATVIALFRFRNQQNSIQVQQPSAVVSPSTSPKPTSTPNRYQDVVIGTGIRNKLSCSAYGGIIDHLAHVNAAKSDAAETALNHVSGGKAGEVATLETYLTDSLKDCGLTPRYVSTIADAQRVDDLAGRSTRRRRPGPGTREGFTHWIQAVPIYGMTIRTVFIARML